MIAGGTSGSVTISHADTSTSGGLDSTGNSNGTVIQNASVSVDTYGHVATTSVSTTNYTLDSIKKFESIRTIII